jgi:hypothetical protein
MVDDHTRERPVLVADSPISGAQAVRELDCLRAWQTLNPVNDNGIDLTSSAILQLQSDHRSAGLRRVGQAGAERLCGRTNCSM